MELKLTKEERLLLEQTLESALGSLREEVYHAEEPDYKDRLKAEETLMKGLLARVLALANG